MIRLVCGGDRREVLLRGSEGGVEVVVDGTPLRPIVEEVAPGTFVLRDGDRVTTFHCVRDGDEIHLFWRGVAYRLCEEREGGRRPRGHHAGGLEAPMPGKVIKVSVGVDQPVTRGQEILVVEAMKMENSIRAPRDGTVRAIRAKVGDLVTPGVVLVEIA